MNESNLFYDVTVALSTITFNITLWLNFFELFTHGQKTKYPCFCLCKLLHSMFTPETKEIIFINSLQVANFLPQLWHGATKCIKMPTKLNNYKIHQQQITKAVYRNDTRSITDITNMQKQKLSVTPTDCFRITVLYSFTLYVCNIYRKQNYTKCQRKKRAWGLFQHARHVRLPAD